MIQKCIKYHGLFWVALFLLAIAYKAISYEGVENIIYFPGAHIFTLALLSHGLIYLFSHLIKGKHLIIKHLVAAIIFGFLYHWISGFVVLMGERLFALPEHYTLHTLFVYFKDYWFIAFEGICWYGGIFITLSLIYYKGLYEIKMKELVDAYTMLKSSSLEVLSAQLQPHFLFNAMNNISMLIRKNEKGRATEMIASLSHLLRRSMSAGEQPKITLADELSFLKEYISLEKLRYTDVGVKIQLDDATRNAKIPQMILQPLVENAFKHLIPDEGNTLLITIDICRKENLLEIEVCNPGVFDAPYDIACKKGIGLYNTIHRLRQMYGTRYSFKIIEERDGVRMVINIPYEE
ncbi:Signal transduction ATPase, FimS family [Fulvivirga imtechensis AK7]|uniref:Signal transduction ATPase, FimS family n=1 Tax=Fulvivirga imtechensis AK7 TaxID=1237149 RepID=L8JSA2_9BACT|nr:histidine kinase [Fulvivirga imtechensis]ELR71093.1 Signal transduction ATPase, FimS family [Fulvivirga imtechensis AK7]